MVAVVVVGSPPVVVDVSADELRLPLKLYSFRVDLLRSLTDKFFINLIFLINLSVPLRRDNSITSAELCCRQTTVDDDIITK